MMTLSVRWLSYQYLPPWVWKHRRKAGKAGHDLYLFVWNLDTFHVLFHMEGRSFRLWPIHITFWDEPAAWRRWYEKKERAS